MMMMMRRFMRNHNHNNNNNNIAFACFDQQSLMLLGQRGKRKGFPLEKRKMLLSGGDISKSTEIASVINDGTENLSIVCDLGKLYSLAGLPAAGQAAGLGEDLTGMMEGFTCGDIESECLLNSNHVDFMELSFWEDESCDTCLLDVRESSERRYRVLDGEEEETNLDSGSIGIETRCEKEEYETTNIPYLNPNHDSTTFQMLAKLATRSQVVGKQIHDSELGDGCYWCPHKVAVGHLIKCWKCTRQFCPCCVMNREHGTNIQRQRLEMDDALQLCPRCKNWHQGGAEPTNQIIRTESHTVGFGNADDDHLVHKTTGELAIAHSKYNSCWAGISDSNSMMLTKMRKALRTEREEEQSIRTVAKTEVSTKTTPKRKEKAPQVCTLRQPQGKRMRLRAADLCPQVVPTTAQEQIRVGGSLVDTSFSNHKDRCSQPSAIDKSTMLKQEPADDLVQQRGFHVNSWARVDGKEMQGGTTTMTSAHLADFQTEPEDVKPFPALPGITHISLTPSTIKHKKRDTTASSQQAASMLRNGIAPFDEAAPGNVTVNVENGVRVVRKYDSGSGASESPPLMGIVVQHVQKTASGEVHAEKGFEDPHTIRVKVESDGPEISITDGGFNWPLCLSPKSDNSQPAGSMAKSSVTGEGISMDRVDALKTTVRRHLFGRDAAHLGDKLSLPSCLQAKTYRQKLKVAAGEPFDRKQYADMWELVNRRKPLLRLRHTRTRTVQFSTRDEGFSYLDHHPDLAARLAEAETLEEKLKLLRGFFFWLQHSCMDGAFKPWAPSPHDTGQGEDCIETDGPDCEVLAVVLQLDEKKDVRSLFHSRSQLLLGHDTTDGVCEDPNAVCIDLEDTGLQTVSEENIETQVDILGARQAAIQQRMSQKSSTCRNCSKEFGTEKRRQRTLFDVCGHTDTCMACVFTLRKLDKHRCPTCGVAPRRKPKPFVENNDKP